MKQAPLFNGPHLPPVYRYQALFEHLPSLDALRRPAPRGRKPISRDFLLRCLIYRGLRRIATLNDLTDELENNPSLVQALGRNPLKPLPSLQRFSRFLRTTDNELLQQVRRRLVRELISRGVVAGKALAIDSSAVPVPVRENNWKMRLPRGRFDKTTPPRGDPEAGVGVQFHFSKKLDRKVAYFWGYRNHVVSDADSELPLLEETHPANVSEVVRACPLLRRALALDLPVEHVIADAEYDAETVLECIAEEMHAQPVVARNPRGAANTPYTIRKGAIHCQAELPMASRGSTRPKKGGYAYRQFGCPIRWLKSFQKKYICCPIQHPKFYEQKKGCNVLIRKTPSIRSQISYNSSAFRRMYRKRAAAERLYSRLLSLNMQQPSTRGLKGIRNHCTIAHIATLLVALAASRSGNPDKVRWIRSFLPDFSKKPIL